MKYMYPVCFYDGLQLPPEKDTICRCCGTQFGLDDYLPKLYSEDNQDEEVNYKFQHTRLHREWIRKGCQWWSNSTFHPKGWTPEFALQKIKEQTSGMV